METMTPTEIKPSEIKPMSRSGLIPEMTPEQLRADLERVERRDWWLWVMAHRRDAVAHGSCVVTTFPD
jgi:hypothetical protein